MTRRMILPLVFGLAGTALLLGLGVWQLQRLAWKQSVLAQIEARIGAAPVPLPETPDPVRDRYLPVRVSGIVTGGLRVLVSVRLEGAGYRMIGVLETEDGRRVLLDRGFLPVAAHTDVAGPVEVTVTGNLHWPDEVDSFTPDPDPGAGLWFARDVPAMAGALGTEPVLIVARGIEPQVFAARPLPVGTAGIPNDHLQYAITWFSLALIWAGMTGYLLWRIRQRTV